jgi:hypothetical protein
MLLAAKIIVTSYHAFLCYSTWEADAQAGPAAAMAIRTITGCTARQRDGRVPERSAERGGGNQGPRGGHTSYKSAGPCPARGGARGGHQGRWGRW